MGLLTTLLTLPVSGPGRGVLWLAAKVQDAAEAEWSDPAEIRRTLGDLERALDKGEIDEETFETAEAALLDRLKVAAARQAGS